MKQVMRLAGAVMLVCVLGAMTFQQSDTGTATTKARNTTFIDFNDVSIVGQMEVPDITIFVDPPKRHFRNLMQKRVNFNQQLERSVDNL